MPLYKTYFSFLPALVIALCFKTVAYGQCTWTQVDLEGFEYGMNCPDLITPHRIIHPAPWSNGHHHGGANYLYMNFVNGLPPGSLVYERFYTVCAGQQYRTSCWYKGVNGSFSNITLRIVDGNGTVLDTWSGASVSGVYNNHISSTVTALTNTISFQLISDWAPGNNDMAFDDLTLSVCAPAAYDEGTLNICQSATPVNLYDSLSSIVGNAGSWVGASPLGNGFQATFDPAVNTSGLYTYTSPNGANCADSIAFFNVNITLAPNLSATDVTSCSSVGADITNSFIDSNATGGAVSYWQDAAMTIPVSNPNSITTAGTYYIKVASGGCEDTVSVNVTLNPLPPIDLGPDTVLCHTQNLTLDAGTGFDHYLWNDASTAQTLTTNGGGVYSVQGFTKGNNVIYNGDFELGDVGFSTNYVPATGGAWGPVSNQGEYLITTSPSLAHNNFPVCTDHTSGAGNIMVVNGANIANQNIWCQTVTVTPNTDYEFSTWVQNYFVPPGGSATQLSFFINGTQVGNTFTMATAGCTWQNFFELWNSGAATSAQICITNQSVAAAGNDFGLDDITFRPLCVSSDAITVTNDTGPVVTVPTNTSYCVGSTVPASAYTTVPAGAMLEWYNSNTAIGLASVSGSTTAGTPNTPSFTSTNPSTTPDTSTISVIPTLNNCPGDTANYLIIVQPMIPAPTADSVFTCVNTPATLTATAPGGTYTWYDAATGGTVLAVAPNYTTNPLIADTSFWVETTLNGCTSARTKVHVLVGQGFTADAGLDVDICPGQTANLMAAPTTTGNTYNWSDPTTPTLGTAANQNVSPTDTTFYTVEITDSYGCTAKDSVAVNVKPIPVVTVPPNTTYCAGDTVFSSVYSSVPIGANYTWVNSDPAIGLNASGAGNTPLFLIANPTTSMLTATISVTPSYLGCAGSPVDYTITATPPPTISTPLSKSYCVGDVVPATSISGTPTGVTFSWTNTNPSIGLNSSGMGDLPAFVSTNTTTFTQTGTITLTPMANGCMGVPTDYSISISAPIIIDRIITHPICFQSNDGSVVAIPSGGTPGYLYDWDTGETDSIALNLSGPITLTVTDANNCTQDSTFNVIEPDSIDYISFSANPRAGCSPLEVTFTNTIDPNLVNEYTWGFGNNLAPQTTWIAESVYTEPGEYDVSLTVVDYDGCENTLTIQDFITVYEDPSAYFSTTPESPTMLNPRIEFGDLSFPNIVAWQWFFDTLGTSNEQSPVFTFPTDSGSYAITLMVEDENTCRDTLTRKVFVLSEYALYFPNSFTPNNDDLNDTFGPKGFGANLKDYSLRIFNRWGELVFETNNINETWDGTYNDKLSPSGTYIWRASFKDLHNEGFQQSGRVSIMR